MSSLVGVSILLVICIYLTFSLFPSLNWFVRSFQLLTLFNNFSLKGRAHVDQPFLSVGETLCVEGFLVAS